MIKFKPQGSYLTVEIPKEALASDIVLPESQMEERRKEYIAKGDELTVVNTGVDCKFVRSGDSVLIDGVMGIKKVELDGSIYYVVRESNILGKMG